MREQIQRIAEWLLQLQQERRIPGSQKLPRFLAASDIHGNCARLEEVIARARDEAVDHIYLVGDLYAGPGGWSVFRLLQQRAPDRDGGGNITLLWGNHELAFVAGMLGNDRQLRFFHSFGGQFLLQEMNAERLARGLPPAVLSGSTKLTAADLATLRAQPELREMCQWIQRTHRLFAVDAYGTGYLHAFPKISRSGHFAFEYQGTQGWPAIPLIERDLGEAKEASHPVFSVLLRTESSPLWALFEITTARQFDQAVRSSGVRQIIFGHRHHWQAVNVSQLNRQIGIAVDFDQGRGGYAVIGAQGVAFHQFVDRDCHTTEVSQLIAPAGGLSAREAHLHDIEEFLFRRMVELEQRQFAGWHTQSAQAWNEFERLQDLKRQGFPWIHRLFAELYTQVQDPALRTEMFASAVASGDEDAFRSFIHLLHQKTFELESYRTDWFSGPYVRAKSIVQVLMNALRDMPVARLGLLDVRIRGTTSRLNLTELYKRILGLEDPDLALAAVHNLGTLRTADANQELRLAFFHNVRKVRVRAAEALASQGEIAYPLVVPLLRSSDNWVRGLALWTIAELGRSGSIRPQAIRDIHGATSRESDWFLRMLGKELLRKLRGPDVDPFDDSRIIPNLTDDIVATLQEIVDCERQPFREGFKIFFITVELSSLVYRRGLIGLDIDDLKIYVNSQDYFPPYYRHYKAGDVDVTGVWRGWRRLWIRGETPNLPDGPQIIQLSREEAENLNVGGRTIVLYDHRTSQGRVTLPPLEQIYQRHGMGKIKDRARHTLLELWSTAFTPEEQTLLSRIHAASLMTMLFGLPAELHVTPAEISTLRSLSERQFAAGNLKPRRLIKLQENAAPPEPGSPRGRAFMVLAQWLDVPKFAVRAVIHG